jgi:hypothetical protein
MKTPSRFLAWNSHGPTETAKTAGSEKGLFDDMICNRDFFWSDVIMKLLMNGRLSRISVIIASRRTIYRMPAIVRTNIDQIITTSSDKNIHKYFGGELDLTEFKRQAELIYKTGHPMIIDMTHRQGNGPEISAYPLSARGWH